MKRNPGRQSDGGTSPARAARWAPSLGAIVLCVLAFSARGLSAEACDPASGCCGAAGKIADDHFVPADKKLDPRWVKSLTAKGGPTWYFADDLKTIGMPIGGICAGQVYLTGDGRLAHWGVFNKHVNTGYGRTNYQVGRVPAFPVDQGFAVRVRAGKGAKAIVRSLDRSGFPGVRFCGEYPIGFVEYRDRSLPVEIRLEAFSPFIPLNADDSALPATVMQFTVANTSKAPAEVDLAGWLENAVCFHSRGGLSGMAVNRAVKRGGAEMVLCEAAAVPPPKEKQKPVVLEDFEGEDYGKWKVAGEAFGKAPAAGTLARQQPVSGYSGRKLVNTYLGGDDRMQGRLTSPPLKIERQYIRFLIGGGDYAGKTCINLVVDGKVVRTATGRRKEQLVAHNWRVADLIGKEARIEIVRKAADCGINCFETSVGHCGKRS